MLFLEAEDQEELSIDITELKVESCLVDQEMMKEKNKLSLEEQDLDRCLLIVLKAIQ